MANESSSTVTNQTNPIGTTHTSKRSQIIVPKKGITGLESSTKERIYTGFTLTRSSNNPPKYRQQIIQYNDAKSKAYSVIATKNEDTGEFDFIDNNIDFKNTDQDAFKKLVVDQTKTQKKDAEKQIKKLVNQDKKSLNKNKGDDTVTESVDSPKESDPPNKGIARKNYGNLFYPSFIQKSSQDKFKVTILEFSSRFKGGKKDPKKMSQLGQINGKPRRSDFGRGRSGRGKYLAELRKIKKGKGKADLNNSNMSALSLDGRKRLEINKRLVGHITLPIPEGVTDQNAVNFGSGTMNPMQVAGAEVALDFLLRGVGEAGESAAEIFKQTATDKNVQQAISALIAGSGIGIDTNDLLASTQGNINNNNLELLFKGPTLRPFTFSFNLSPRDVQEAGQVQKIIRAFKQSSAVQRTPGGIFLATPNTYKLEFIDGKTSSTHRFLPKIKECALLGVNVNYMPENSYMTYENSSMVAYNLQLAFKELEPIFNDDYEDSDQEQLPGTFPSSVTTAFNIGF